MVCPIQVYEWTEHRNPKRKRGCPSRVCHWLCQCRSVATVMHQQNRWHAPKRRIGVTHCSNASPATKPDRAARRKSLRRRPAATAIWENPAALNAPARRRPTTPIPRASAVIFPIRCRWKQEPRPSVRRAAALGAAPSAAETSHPSRRPTLGLRRCRESPSIAQYPIRYRSTR